MTKVANSTTKPIIGVVPDFKTGSPTGYAIYDYYAIRANYLNCLIEAGAIPIILPYDHNSIEQYLEMIDALMIVGGDVDLSPSLYHQNFVHPKTKINLVRENFEVKLLDYALKKKPLLGEDTKNSPINLPILGICNGMQLIAVLHGAQLIQHIPDNQKLMIHEQKYVAQDLKDPGKPYHSVSVVKNSRFQSIVKTNEFKVNSTHHQAVESLENTDLEVCATAPDGLIEAFQDKNHNFCVGVQWHPEYLISTADKNLFTAFVEEARIYSEGKQIL